MTRHTSSNLTGREFSRLTAIGLAPPGARGNKRWLCRCECGTFKVVFAQVLKNGGTKSCGCYIRELSRNRLLRHGHTTHGNRSQIYDAWQSMRSRCNNPKNKAYRNYGGRGIAVCERWNSSFLDFVADMGEPPSANLSLDRINNNGNYEPENCRWATWTQQRHNRRDSVRENIEQGPQSVRPITTLAV